jgi:hypothetical protein
MQGGHPTLRKPAIGCSSGGSHWQHLSRWVRLLAAARCRRSRQLRRRLCIAWLRWPAGILPMRPQQHSRYNRLLVAARARLLLLLLLLGQRRHWRDPGRVLGTRRQARPLVAALAAPPSLPVVISRIIYCPCRQVSNEQEKEEEGRREAG